MTEMAPVAPAATRLRILDCDIHPTQKRPEDLHPFMQARRVEHMKTFGRFMRQALIGQLACPRMTANGMRADAQPADGPAGSSPEMLRGQHLDPMGIETGMLIALGRGGMEERNPDFAAALASAVNDWQIATLVEPEPRLKAGIVVPQDNPETAGLPIGLHTAGHSGGHPSTGLGWPGFCCQERYTFVPGAESLVTSLIIEGVFARVPRLKVAIIGGGFSWVPALGWRMDRHWETFRAEVPHLTRPPSETLREHFWFATQPVEEPRRARDLEEVIDWIGWDRMLCSSDYPHWDYDDPHHVFRFPLADRCPHAGASLAAGRLSGTVESDGPGSYRLCRQGEMVKCPWHGSGRSRW